MAFDANRISEPDNTDRIGEWLLQQVDGVLEASVAMPIEKLATTLAPIIVVALTLQFLAYTMALMRGFGDISVTEFFWKAIRIAIIASVATAGGLYQTTISSAMLTLPDDLAGVVAGGHTVTSQIDELRSKTEVATSTLEDSEGKWYPSSKNVLVSLYAGYLSIMTALISAGVAVLMIVVKVGMALIVATGPLFIAALAFESTRRLFDSWVAQALNFVFLALLIGLVFAFLLQMNLMYVSMMIRLLHEGSVQLLSLLGGYALTGIATLVILVFLPGIAQGLSGGFGAQFGVGAAARGSVSTLRSVAILSRFLPGRR